MAKGRPDYTSVTEIQGTGPAGTPVTLAVDASGRLYAILYGTEGVTLRPVAVDASGRLVMVAYGTVDVGGQVDVVQVAKDREVQGSDGATLRTLAVDASGQVIMVPRGQSGNYLNVDTSGYLTSVIKGLDGVTLRTVAVDSAGNIIGVLQGDYEGALKTLAVDSQGRMLAVLTDPEDVFGNPHYMGAAELAARLGSVHNFYRTGQVLFQEDFEQGKNRVLCYPTGATSAATLSNTLAQSGSFALKVIAGDTATDNVSVTRVVSYPAFSKFGLEASFHPQHTNYSLELHIYLRDGEYQYHYAVRYVYSTQKWYYWGAAGAWVELVTGALLAYNATLFYHIKLIVDLVNDKYHRLWVNAQYYGMNLFDPQVSASAISPQLRNDVIFYTEEAASKTFYLDDIIITQNEPA